MRTGFKIAVVVGLASLVLAGVALAGWGGGGYRRGGGPGPGLQGRVPADPQNQAPWMGRGPWGGASGPQAGPAGPGRGARPQINSRQAPGGNYGFCPRCGVPWPGGGRGAPWAGSGYGPIRGQAPRFGRGGGPGPGFQAGPWGPQGQGFGRRNMMTQPGPMNGGWGQGLRPGRGSQDLQPQNARPWDGPDRRGWRQPGNTDEPGPQVTPPQPPERPDRGGFWGPLRDEGSRGRGGRGLRPWGSPDVDDSEEVEENDSATSPEAESTQQVNPQ